MAAPRKYSDAQIDEALELHRTVGHREAVRRTGVSSSTIWRYAKAEEVPCANPTTASLKGYDDRHPYGRDAWTELEDGRWRAPTGQVMLASAGPVQAMLRGRTSAEQTAIDVLRALREGDPGRAEKILSGLEPDLLFRVWDEFEQAYSLVSRVADQS